VRVLFFMSHPGAIRNFGGAVDELARRGHYVHMAFERCKQADDIKMAEDVASQHEIVTYGEAPHPDLAIDRVGRALRMTLDYLRYFEPEFVDATLLRSRARRFAAPPMRMAVRMRWVRSAPGREWIAGGARALDSALPVHGGIASYIQRRAPDLVLVTPLIEFRSAAPEFLRAGAALGLPTGLCVHSWDNLTNKGLIHGDPDLITVWNDAQVAEAVHLHRVARSSVVAVGAHPYDHWFGQAPSSTRAEFCARLGLDAERPLILYVCSSSSIAPHEQRFIDHWLNETRAASATLRESNVLIRPHPANPTTWDEIERERCVVWPPNGANPVDERSREDYFDSIYHSAGVVGLNTSAQIESSIVGRRVHTLLLPELRGGQEATLHFRHLMPENGGPLRVARSIGEHVRQLEASLQAGGNDEAATAFLERFVRPFGLEQPATPRLVDTLEAAAAARPSPRPSRGRLPYALARAMAYLCRQPAPAVADKGRPDVGKPIAPAPDRHEARDRGPQKPAGRDRRRKQGVPYQTTSAKRKPRRSRASKTASSA
jgi:hypothetical protein